MPIPIGTIDPFTPRTLLAVPVAVNVVATVAPPRGFWMVIDG
jgi:hypothetical protein